MDLHKAIALTEEHKHVGWHQYYKYEQDKLVRGGRNIKVSDMNPDIVQLLLSHATLADYAQINYPSFIKASEFKALFETRLNAGEGILSEQMLRTLLFAIRKRLIETLISDLRLESPTTGQRRVLAQIRRSYDGSDDMREKLWGKLEIQTRLANPDFGEVRSLLHSMIPSEDNFKLLMRLSQNMGSDFTTEVCSYVLQQFELKSWTFKDRILDRVSYLTPENSPLVRGLRRVSSNLVKNIVVQQMPLPNLLFITLEERASFKMFKQDILELAPNIRAFYYLNGYYWRGKERSSLPRKDTYPLIEISSSHEWRILSKHFKSYMKD